MELIDSLNLINSKGQNSSKSAAKEVPGRDSEAHQTLYSRYYVSRIYNIYNNNNNVI